MGFSSSSGWASDHGEPRSAWWSAGILRFFVSVCLAGVMVSGCCWLALVRRNRSLTVSFLQFFGFASGCTISSVFFRFNPCGFFRFNPCGFFRFNPCGFFRFNPCGFFRFNSCGFFQVQSLRFFQVRDLWLFRVAPCGFSSLSFAYW